jgi:flagellar motor component MotA
MKKEDSANMTSYLDRPNDLHFNQYGAGGGVLGVIILLISVVFAIFLNMSAYYGTMMTVIAIGLFGYNIDSDMSKLLRATMRVLFRNRHITDLSHEMIHCNNVLDNIERKFSTHSGKSIDRMDPDFNKDAMAKYISNRKDLNKETLTNHFENEVFNTADESYSVCISTFENVGNLMPLVGLIGTVYGIQITLDGMGTSSDISEITTNVAVAMQTTLWGGIYSFGFKVLASRFKQKRDALEYDFERLQNHIELIYKEDAK